jgi:hypothetical protein
MGRTTLLRPRLLPVCQTIAFSFTDEQGRAIRSFFRRPVTAASLIAAPMGGSA